ncbi:MAG: hypothetical protein AABP62_29370 [Planctomycetota bacterium]
MSQSHDFRFAIMNGECHITDESISFTYDHDWERFVRVFGKPSWRRSAVMALVVGVPLSCLGLACIALEQWHLALYPLFFGLLLMSAPLLNFFSEEYFYPASIARSDIQAVTSRPPTMSGLGYFTITFMSEGVLCKTCFGPPTGNYRERVRSFQAVTEAFVQMGLISETTVHPSV